MHAPSPGGRSRIGTLATGRPQQTVGDILENQSTEKTRSNTAANTANTAHTDTKTGTGGDRTSRAPGSARRCGPAWHAAGRWFMEHEPRTQRTQPRTQTIVQPCTIFGTQPTRPRPPASSG